MSFLSRVGNWILGKLPGHVPPGRAKVIHFINLDDEEEKPLGPVDWLGTPIQVFSRVLFPSTFAGNLVQMSIGQVTEIKEDGGLVVQVEGRSRSNAVRRALVHLTTVGARNATVIK
jgi:hypothetical protein